MRVKIKLFATLARYREGSVAGRQFEVELPEEASLLHLVQALNIPPGETRVMFVNGIIQEADWPLKEGDEVGLFPPVGGG